MAILRYIEWGLAQLLYRARGHDANLLTRSDLFKAIPQNIHVTSPELGPSGSHLTLEQHSKLGANKFPRLQWSLAPDTAGISPSDIQEYMLVCEDADSPLPTPGLHGLYYSIPPSKTSVGPEDFEIDTDTDGKGDNDAAATPTTASTTANTSTSEPKWLKGGFRLGRNHRGSVYIGPRPPVGHGPHRYFFQVVALKEKVKTAEMSPVATKEELMQQINGKIIGWGVWVGIFEHKW